MRLGATIKKWLPVALWILMIFIGSTDILSTHRTSRWLVPIIRWFKPDITYPQLRRVLIGARKTGHLTEYAVLAVLLWRAIPRDIRPGSSAWRWPDAGMVQGVCAFFAMSDEFHQSFIPSRYASWGDVLIDTAGAAIGLAMVWWFCRRRKDRRPGPLPIPGQSPSLPSVAPT